MGVYVLVGVEFFSSFVSVCIGKKDKQNIVLYLDRCCSSTVSAQQQMRLFNDETFSVWR